MRAVSIGVAVLVVGAAASARRITKPSPSSASCLHAPGRLAEGAAICRGTEVSAGSRIPGTSRRQFDFTTGGFVVARVFRSVL